MSTTKALDRQQAQNDELLARIARIRARLAGEPTRSSGGRSSGSSSAAV
jgi:hypothetical protein